MVRSAEEFGLVEFGMVCVGDRVVPGVVAGVLPGDVMSGAVVPGDVLPGTVELGCCAMVADAAANKTKPQAVFSAFTFGLEVFMCAPMSMKVCTPYAEQQKAKSASCIVRSRSVPTEEW
jgi:hypothetical protein